ncbi:MAG TPA: FtsX-like permease family protein [Halanaerobiales bacterium]|nr:FtsX-like permease family protein [Halanaerobiales bacterium]
MFLLKLAYKNLFRYWKRTLIAAFIIAMAVFVYLIMDSMLLGMEDMTYENIIKYESGHLQIADKKYWEDKDELPLENLVPLESRFNEDIKKTEGYISQSPQLRFQALLNNKGDELPVIGVGINPTKALEVFDLKENLVVGTFFQNEERKVVLGKTLAELMDVNLGDYITLIFKTSTETFNTIDAQVSGLLETTNPNINNNFIYLPLDIAQNSLSVGNKVSRIIIRLNNKSQVNNAKSQLNNILGNNMNNLGVYTWNELEVAEVLNVDQVISKLLLAIILIIGAMGIINTVILAALERMEEIGMMKALGLKEREIVQVFMYESIGIGIIGVIVGSIFGALTIWYLVNFGMDYAIFMEGGGKEVMGDVGFPLVTKIYSSWNQTAFIIVNSFGLMTSALASIFPAYWAAKKDPIKALQHRK